MRRGVCGASPGWRRVPASGALFGRRPPSPYVAVGVPRLAPVPYFFLDRFSRTRTEMWIGVPSKPNSSRSLRSTKRR